MFSSKGVSWTLTERHPSDYGKEHLLAALVLLDKMLEDPKKQRDPLVQFILGWYPYWDMSYSFIADPHGLTPPNAHVFNAVHTMRGSFHLMVGFPAELEYNLAAWLKRK